MSYEMMMAAVLSVVAPVASRRGVVRVLRCANLVGRAEVTVEVRVPLAGCDAVTERDFVLKDITDA